MFKNIIIVVLSCLLYINWSRKIDYFTMAYAYLYLLMKNEINVIYDNREILALEKAIYHRLISFKTFFL